MKKEHIVIVLVLVAVLAASGAVYQFYFKPRLTIYSQDQERTEVLKSKITNLQNTFSNFAPEAIVSAWNLEVQPWTDAVFVRGAFFAMPDQVLKGDPVPDEMMLKFYYRDESEKLLNALYEKVRTHTPYCYYPYPTRFGAPDPEAFPTMNKEQVETSLYLIRLGSYMVDMLLKAKAAEITDVVIWPVRLEYDNLLSLRTVGLSFRMTMENLVLFIENDLRTADRYFSVDAISVQNRQLRLPQQPFLEVRMLVSQALFREGATASGEAAGEGKETAVSERPRLTMGGPGGASSDVWNAFARSRSGGRERLPAPTKFQRFVRWMRKYVIPL